LIDLNRTTVDEYLLTAFQLVLYCVITGQGKKTTFFCNQSLRVYLPIISPNVWDVDWVATQNLVTERLEKCTMYSMIFGIA